MHPEGRGSRHQGNLRLGESSWPREIRGGFPLLVLLLAGPLLTACASNKPLPESRGATYEPCDGVTVLVVVNRTDVEVEIVESRVGSGARTVIGTVSPGSREFVIRGEPGYTYSSRRLNRGPTISATSRSRVSEQNAVELRRECRAR